MPYLTPDILRNRNLEKIQATDKKRFLRKGRMYARKALRLSESPQTANSAEDAAFKAAGYGYGQSDDVRQAQVNRLGYDPQDGPDPRGRRDSSTTAGMAAETGGVDKPSPVPPNRRGNGLLTPEQEAGNKAITDGLAAEGARRTANANAQALARIQAREYRPDTDPLNPPDRVETPYGTASASPIMPEIAQQRYLTGYRGKINGKKVVNPITDPLEEPANSAIYLRKRRKPLNTEVV